MTVRCYYYDATLREFTARVQARRVLQDSARVEREAVSLDQTAFYPTSGGQPHDTGWLADVPVVDVQKGDEGEIWHLLERPLPPEIHVVQGRIDWTRRFDHMQQHTGQHLLSAAFARRLEAATVGFHLGREVSTIDLTLFSLTWEAAAQVEREVNEVIWQNRPVTVHFVQADAVERFPLRKPPKVQGQVRIVVVDGYDASACGGTHVRATGEIGVVKIVGIEHYKGGSRVRFLCGGRAFGDYQARLDTLRNAAQMLTVGMDEVPEAVSRLQQELQAVRRAHAGVRQQLLDYRARELSAAAPQVGDVRVVAGYWQGEDVAYVRALAMRLREEPRLVVLLAAPTSKGVHLICARSEDLTEVDARVVLREALGMLGGRGGGRPELAQGGAPACPPSEVWRAMVEALQHSGLEVEGLHDMGKSQG